MTLWRVARVILLLALLLDGEAPPSPGYAAYERANQLFIVKKLPQAVDAVNEALRLDPKLIPALTLKAKLAMAASQLDVAQRCLERALALDPRAQYAQFLYGLEAFLANDLVSALPRLRRARALNPEDPRSALYLGLTVESLGRPEEALSLYRDAVRLERNSGTLDADTLLPAVRLFLLLGRLTECEKWLQQAEQLSPQSRDVHFEAARLLLKKGDAAQAAKEGEKTLALSEGAVSDASIHYLLIRAYDQSGQPDRAEMHAEIMRAQETPPTENTKR